MVKIGQKSLPIYQKTKKKNKEKVEDLILMKQLVQKITVLYPMLLSLLTNQELYGLQQMMECCKSPKMVEKNGLM